MHILEANVTQKQQGKLQLILSLYHTHVYIQSQTLVLGKLMIYLFQKEVSKIKNLCKTLSGFCLDVRQRKTADIFPSPLFNLPLFGMYYFYFFQVWNINILLWNHQCYCFYVDYRNLWS